MRNNSKRERQQTCVKHRAKTDTELFFNTYLGYVDDASSQHVLSHFSSHISILYYRPASYKFGTHIQHQNLNELRKKRKK